MIRVQVYHDVEAVCPNLETATKQNVCWPFLQTRLRDLESALINRDAPEITAQIKELKDHEADFSTGQFSLNGNTCPLLAKAQKEDWSQAAINSAVAAIDLRINTATTIKKAEWVFVKTQLQKHKFREEGTGEWFYRKVTWG